MTEWWNSILEIEGARWIIYPSALITLLLVAYYVLQLIRNMAIGGGNTDSDYLGSFRKMRDEGMLAPEEYKKLAELVPLPETETQEPSAVDPAPTKPEPLTLKEAMEKAKQQATMKNPPVDGKESGPLDAGESLEP